MIDYHEIYRSFSDEYDLLVSREDCQKNIIPALAAIRPLEGLNAIELGAGTARLTRMLVPMVDRILAVDNSVHMLATARRRLTETGLGNWSLALSDNRRLPVRARQFDLAVAGWTLGHFVGWYGQNWKNQIDNAVTEMKRVIKPSGTIIIMETLGTGTASPRPPNKGLATYYSFLEEQFGFSKSWIRTDYTFSSPEEAERLTRFFFGEELAERVARDGVVDLPECTGIWWLTT